jgi:hypothetical protein
MQLSVTGEYYRVVSDIGAGRPAIEGPFASPAAAIERAMRITLDERQGCAVERVTVHEPYEALTGAGFAMVAETVTGRITVPGPRSWDHDPQLSRYHPVNGWVVPAEIEVGE